MEPSPSPLPRFILPLDSPEASLATAGGKGDNLARLLHLGMPVPPGFIISVEAYRAFLSANQLEQRILDCLEGLQSSGGSPDGAALETASLGIRDRFAAGQIPAPLAQAILSAYRGLGGGAAAVRSSATAEDLPDLSFAGQQDTFLNVTGDEALLRSVIRCWSSLWTARAIGYRIRNQVDHTGVSLAVIVQRMVESQASGVLFTANPLTGLRSETVIDASLGLGEALVSGLVEPDHYVVDTSAVRITSRTIGRKTLSIHGLPQGGTHTVEQDRSAIQALPDEQILALTRLAGQVAAHYASPQDIEWAWAGGKLFLLQSRPITSLFPLPPGLPAEPLKVFFSFGAVQGMLDPLTPIGIDAMKVIFAAGAGLFGYKVDSRTQTTLYVAGERLWINFTAIVSNSVGRKAIRAIIGMLEPTIGQALEAIWDDSRLAPGRQDISHRARLRLAGFFLPLLGNILLNLLSPRQRRASIIASGERILARLSQRIASFTGDSRAVLAQKAALLTQDIVPRFPFVFLRFVSAVATGMFSWNLLRLLNPFRGQPSSPQNKAWAKDILELSRGMPNNPTTEMDLSLWQIARDLRADAEASRVMTQYAPRELTARFRAGELPSLIQSRISGFLQVYGGRGLGEIDMGRPRWAKDPTHVFEMLASFMRIADPQSAPDAVFSRGVQAAQLAIDEMCRIARSSSRLGWPRAGLVRFLAGRARQWLGARESPKFFAVRMLAILQRSLLLSGEDFVRSGDLRQPDDLIYLSLDEIQTFAVGEKRDWQALIASRRQARERELRRAQIPRLLLSDGRAFYGGLRSNGAGALSGSPVSPGSAIGRVRVVLDPTQANLQPGEILVCPGTDPSWTPLFLSAAGLVMEVGGMMTHGAVVAREYGIPAIVGVDAATTRLKTGMLIQIDGSSGQIEPVEDK